MLSHFSDGSFSWRCVLGVCARQEDIFQDDIPASLLWKVLE